MLQGFQNICICIFRIFLRISRHFQICCFGKQKKKKELFAQRPLEESISSQIRPWPDLGVGEAAGSRIPAPAAAGGEGEHGEKLESGERNLGVALVGRGAA